MIMIPVFGWGKRGTNDNNADFGLVSWVFQSLGERGSIQIYWINFIASSNHRRGHSFFWCRSFSIFV